VRADALGVYGNSSANTPNLDKLANNGLRFENCYAAAPITLPSHSSMFTGKYPITINVRTNGGYFLETEEETLAEYLKGKGYYNYAVIAAFVLAANFGLAQGFDVYDDTLNNSALIRDINSEIPADEVYKKFKYHFQKNKEKKFFAWVHFFDPHLPYNPPARYISGGGSSTIHRYNGEISHVDFYIGKIIDDLKFNNCYENTMIVIAGDHGESFGLHNEFGHRIFCFQENLKVPLIFFYPPMIQPSVIKSRVSLIDIKPTIQEFLGDSISDGTEGQSLARFFRDNREPGKERTLYFESMTGKEEYNWASLYSVLHGKFKYIMLPEEELYDIANDPDEKNNLSRKKNQLTVRGRKMLQTFLADHEIKGRKNKRQLSKTETAHLQSLGYLSATPTVSRGETPIDPKQGILVENEMARYGELIRAKKLDEAEKGLLKLIQQPVKIKLAYLHLAQVYQLKNNIEAAISTLKSAVKQLPDADNFRVPLAELLFDQKRYDEALVEIDVALKQNTLNPHINILKGDIYAAQYKMDQAFESYQKAIRLDPGNIPLNMKYADLLIKNNQYARAVDIYENVIKYKAVGENVEFLFWYVRFNTQLGKTQRAQDLMARIVELKPSGNFYFYYALTLANNNKFQEAIKQMKIATQNYNGELSEKQLSDSQLFINQWSEGTK
jgi:arylsulfatase A-like enzyme/Tfp pilus assembly protein PilF